jgi:hypothetical protein
MPPDEEAITQQRTLLTQNRRRLAVLLQQQARLGDYVPPHVPLEIEDIQTTIRAIKERLRTDDAQVEDEPNDDAVAAAVADSSRLSPQEQRNRNRMLDKVEAFWVKGVLEQSLYQVARLELGFEQAPAQVSHPWETVLHRGSQPNLIIPPGKPIIAVFDDLLGELLILGAPGAGKTTMLLELTRDLIRRARNNEQHPIPVVLNLSTWATKRLPLGMWLAEELNQRYDVPKKLAHEWATKNAVLPLLDGLDEVAAEHREACVEAINEFRTAYGFVPLAVCSRITDYAALTSKLRLQGAIVIQPLTKVQVDDYLKRVGRPLAAVRAALHDDPALWELMESPLLLSIVALAYKDITVAKLRASATSQARRQQLFNDYITAMFARPGRSSSGLYHQSHTERTLKWLAARMVEQQQTVLYIEWLQPSWLHRTARRRFALHVGLLSASVGGLAGGLFGGLIGGWALWPRGIPIGILVGGLVSGLVFGLVGGLSSYATEIRPVERLRWSWTAAGGGRRSSLIFALAFGLLGALGIGRAALTGLFYPGMSVTLLVGLLTGLGGWVLGWLIGEVTDGRITKRMFVDNPRFGRLVWYVLGGGLLGTLFPGALGAWLGALLGALLFVLTIRDTSKRIIDHKSMRRAAQTGLICGIIFGLLVALLNGPTSGFGAGLFGTTFGWLGSWLRPAPKTQQATLQEQPVRRFARNALTGGLITGLGSGLLGGLVVGPVAGVVIGLAGGLAGAVGGGMLSGLVEGSITTRTIPNEGVHRSARSGLVGGLMGGLVLGVFFGLFFQLFSGVGFQLFFGLFFGVFFALSLGLLYGGATVLQHYALRWLLYRNGFLPLRLVPFLDYCVDRIFLRRVGGGYIFVHRLLMEHFASLNMESSTSEPVKEVTTTP